MYRGFNLKIGSACIGTNFVEYGKNLNNDNSEAIKYSIKNSVKPNGIIDGKELQKIWFPGIDARIFISHSHDDEAKAMQLAGWLKHTFNINSFIDSCVWRYANDLLKILDNDYCFNKGDNTYSYKKRNFSTSHIHMMLATAISSMMAKTECLIFLNTPNSITINEDTLTTQSPWLFLELSIYQIIEKKNPRVKLNFARRTQMNQKLAESKKLDIAYSLNLGQLHEIDIDSLIKWEEKYKETGTFKDSLDVMYELNPERQD